MFGESLGYLKLELQNWLLTDMRADFLPTLRLCMSTYILE